ncbi:MAG: DUF4852 domain-containing protein [Bdellovibrionales bacterium]
MFFRFLCLVLLAFSLFTGRAQAQEYSQISWINLIHTLVRFNALNLLDQNLLDEYAIISECDLYKKYYQNDFKWNQVRQAIRESVSMNVATYPTNYQHDLTMRLGRFDFEGKIFRFDEKSSLHGVNTFALLAVDGTGCGGAKVEYIPRVFRAILSSPIFLEGLPLSEEDAQALLTRMEKNQNPERIIFLRYNFRTVYVEPLRKIEERRDMGQKAHYAQTNAGSQKEVKFDMQLDSVGFYEDPQRTKLIYQYTP